MKEKTLPAEMATNGVTGPATTVHGRWLLIVRVMWVAIAVLTISVHITNKAYLVRSVMTPPGAEDELAMRALGLSQTFWIGAMLAVPVAYFLVAGVIAWRKFDDWLVLFVSGALMSFGAIVLFIGAARWQVDRTVDVIRAIGWSSLFILFLVFPDGRFVPRWSRWAGAVWAAFAVSWLFFPALNVTAQGEDSFIPIILMLIGCLGVGASVQTYRYVRVSNPVQRQQTKWVLFGFVAAFLTFCGAVTVMWLGEKELFPAALQQHSWDVFILLWLMSMICIPVSMGSGSCVTGSGTSTRSSTARWSIPA
jgi:hypothetical protein